MNSNRNTEKYRETYAEVRLENIAHNIGLLKKTVAPAEIIAVLKADAYGHGAAKVFETLLGQGIRRFAVANVHEALELRSIDENADILVFGNIAPDYIETAIENKLTLTIFSYDFWLLAAARLRGRSVKVHIKVNTGFNRLGFDYSCQSVREIAEICGSTGVTAEGIYTHFALYDYESDTEQFKLFNKFTGDLSAIGVNFPLRHIADSIAAVQYDWARLDAVRLGAVMYGLKANSYDGYDRLSLKGSLRLYSSVVQVRNIKAGSAVSYGKSFVAGKDMKIAVVAIGYGDGYIRVLSNKGCVVINGKVCPIIGLICMDSMIADITGVEVDINDRALILETDADSPVSAAKLALYAGTNKNEIISSLTGRVKRVYAE